MTRRPLVISRWSTPRARGATLRRLKKIETHLIEIGGLWGDVDEYLVSRADDLRREVRNLRDELNEHIKTRAQEIAAREAQDA